MAYRVEILDSTLTPVTQIKAFVPLNAQNQWLEYSTKLSDFGQAKFRVGTRDPLFDSFGDILQPYANHVRIYRANAVVWQGVIVNCPRRNKNFIEVEAYEYEYLLTKVLIRHDTSGDVNYRTLKSGTMADAVQTFITEAKADAGNILSNLTVGTVENPNFPTGYVDFNNTALTGAWTFSPTFTVKYDYRTVDYVIRSLAVYGVCDFQVVNDPTTNKLTLNFKKFLGNKQPDLMFEYSNYGSIEDFEAPLDGANMANYIVGVAADNQYNILKADKTDPVSLAKYGKVSGVAAYADVKDKNLLATRVAQELVMSSTPDTEVNALLNDRAYTLGVYGVGDTVTFRIKHHILNINTVRRITAIDIKVNREGKETIRLITNPPRQEQI